MTLILNVICKLETEYNTTNTLSFGAAALNKSLVLSDQLLASVIHQLPHVKCVCVSCDDHVMNFCCDTGGRIATVCIPSRLCK